MYMAAALALAAVVWTPANSVATGDQDTPAVATNRNGQVAVVWEDDRDSVSPADNAHSDVWVRLFADGVPVYEKKLSAGGTGESWRHLTPDVALDDRGNAVVVWADDPDGNGFFNIPYRVLSPTGAILASGQANSGSAGNQIRPRVAADPDGVPASATAVGFTVVWEDIPDGGSPRIKAAGFTSAATRAWEVTASATTGTNRTPDVAVPASGDALITWEQDADGNGYDEVGLVRLARLTGAVNLSRRTANANAGGQQRRPAVAANFNGDFALAWESDHTGARAIWTRSFAAGGSPRYAEVATALGTAGVEASIGIADSAATVVGWTVADDVFAQAVEPSGAERLPAAAIGQVPTGRQEQLELAVSPWGEIAYAYTDDADGNTWDQVNLGLGATDSTWCPAFSLCSDRQKS